MRSLLVLSLREGKRAREDILAAIAFAADRERRLFTRPAA
jgi:hypothetical protein